jgi:hypothetical protein
MITDSQLSSNKHKLNSVVWVREETIQTERPPLVGELSAKFADRGFRVVSVTDPYGRILDFLDRTSYFFFQAAPQLYSRGRIDSIPDPLLLRKSGSAGIEPWPLDPSPGTLTTRPQRVTSIHWPYPPCHCLAGWHHCRRWRAECSNSITHVSWIAMQTSLQQRIVNDIIQRRGLQMNYVLTHLWPNLHFHPSNIPSSSQLHEYPHRISSLPPHYRKFQSHTSLPSVIGRSRHDAGRWKLPLGLHKLAKYTYMANGYKKCIYTNVCVS